jgi:hypothetical protein
MDYHIELSPKAGDDIRKVRAPFRKPVAYGIRGVLGDPDSDVLRFKIADGLWGVLVANFVVFFRFMEPEELDAKGVGVPGRYVMRVAHQDELEEVVGELAQDRLGAAGDVRAATEELLKAVREAIRRRRSS